MYNCERYIADCLESILQIDLPTDDYEVIVINDGSTDNSLALVNNFAERYHNIHCLTTSNQGQAAARNTGIKQSKGRYLWFVDADDKIDADEFQKAYSELWKQENLDYLAFRLNYVTEDNIVIEKGSVQKSLEHYIFMSGRDAIIDGYMPLSLCTMFINRFFLTCNNLFLHQGIVHEDVELSYRMTAKAEKVLFTDFVPYIYIKHPNSTSTSFNPTKKTKYLCDELVVYKSFTALAEEHKNDSELFNTIYKRAESILFALLLALYRNKKQWQPLGINRAVINKMEEEGLYPVKGRTFNWKKRLMLLLLNRKWIIC